MLGNKKTQFAKKNRETILPSKTALFINYIVAVLLFAVSFVIAIMLFTYSPDDNSWFKASNNLITHNQLGPFGAYFSDILLSVFGFSAWWLVLGAFYLAYIKITQNKVVVGSWYSILQVISFIFLLLASSIFEYLLLYYHTGGYLHNGFGGVFGKLFYPIVAHNVGQVATTWISGVVIITSFAISFNLYFLFLLEKSGQLSEFMFKMLGRLISRKDVSVENTLDNSNMAEEDLEDVDFEMLLDNLDENGTPNATMIDDDLSTVSNPFVNPEPKPSILKTLSKLKPNLSDSSATNVVETKPAASAKAFRRDVDSTLPSTDLLNNPKEQTETISAETLDFVSMSIENKLAEFGVEAKVINAETGPVITRYELVPSRGVRGDKIVGLGKEIARGLALTNVRIVETIPGKNSMGIEVPNFKRHTIYLKEIFDSPIYQHSSSKLTLALGKDISGQVVVTDLAKMPHLLVAGTTGSGKSVAVNAMILSILFQATPEEVKFIMIDPKMVELSFYQDIPHLLAPVVTDMTQAANALKWTVGEMERRYKIMAKFGCKNIVSFNQKVETSNLSEEDPDLLTGTESEIQITKWPYIVVIIDELADLMMVVGKKVEQYIARIAQKARAVGIHLIVATQRPSVDVITGLIKANIPARISFQVSSKIDSRTILDQMGAEALLGQGDMLFLQPGTGFPQRIHGAFVNDDELNKVVDFLKSRGTPEYEHGILTGETEGVDIVGLEEDGADTEKDQIFDEAVKFIYDSKRCSISSLQTRFSIGYNRAARIMTHLEQIGMVKRNDRGGYEICKVS